MQWRIKFLIFFFGVLYLILIFNIYNLQIEKEVYYLTKAETQSRLNGVFEAIRGNIYFIDKNNNLIPAALNKDYPTVFAVPDEILKDSETMTDYTEKLSSIFNFSIKELEEKLSKQDDLYELLIEKASSKQLNEINNLNLKGIYTDSRLLRFYPFEKIASHLLGFVGLTDVSKKGLYGVESYFDKELSGRDGEIKDNKIIKSEEGENIILTIDYHIQVQAEEILEKLIKDYQAVGGSVIVQESKTGKIMAMANFPNFNPNDYSKFNIASFLNPSVEAVYEPGSIFKVITMSAGIDSGKITPETTYEDEGSVTFNGRTIRNWDLKSHGVQTMTGVIEQSINTGAVFAQRETGPDIFYNYLVKFGFGELTGIDLPGEVRGSLNNLKNGKDIDFATASFGQGVSVTPIQLINAVSVIANGGVLMKPIILENEKPQEIRRVISLETAEKVSKMMVSAVEKNILAAIPNYSIAGKTGTAFVPDFKKGGYSDEVINTYVGFISNPFSFKNSRIFTILVKLEKPKGSPLAGQTVVPAFRELMQFILNYYNISPENL
ncbi:penicillin-binding protein 2 [Candidatus Wolfebacteria bacterium]|nr:penicillin-binding protein 2 [Candidatus Wolfebacteria bacterium]